MFWLNVLGPQLCCGSINTGETRGIDFTLKRADKYKSFFIYLFILYFLMLCAQWYYTSEQLGLNLMNIHVVLEGEGKGNTVNNIQGNSELIQGVQ